MSEPEHRYFQSMRLRLHYLVWGDESKPALILVHGGSDHSRNWDFVAEKLLDRYAIYAPDLRGHGDSDWASGGGYDVSSYVADLARLVEVLDRPRLDIVAHSLGGRITLDYAAAFPERLNKVVVIEPVGGRVRPEPPVNQIQRFVRNVRSLEPKAPHPYETIEDAARRMKEVNRRLSDAMAMHLTTHALRRLEDGTYVWKFDIFSRMAPAPDWDLNNIRAIWQSIKVPVLQVCGRDSWGSRFANGVELSDSIPDVRTEIFDNAHHWVHHDRLDDFVKLVRDFLAE